MDQFFRRRPGASGKVRDRRQRSVVAEKGISSPATGLRRSCRLILALVLASGHCAAAAVDSEVFIKNVPHVKQKTDFCGEACVEMVLRKLGFPMSQDHVFNCSGLDPVAGHGCCTADLARAMKKIGFDPGAVWYPVDAKNTASGIEKQWKAMHADLASGIPSIVCTRFDESPSTTEHFRLVLGYDPKTDEVIYHDPALDDGSNLRMKRARLLGLWQLKGPGTRVTAIRLRCLPAGIVKAAAPVGFTPADYVQHVMALRQGAAGKGYHIMIEPPFVVLGDEEAGVVRERARQTVKWAVDKLKQDYFTKDPDTIIDIWLFKDKESYEKNTVRIFHEKPTTPYGFYSDRDNALIMNIATGGGTLVHEIVHPFVRANFPGCPAWFNEGLGSLYEQSSSRDGHIVGLTNWRLAGLKQEIANGTLPSFAALLGSTEHEFYSSKRGNNYAQARYLCYYLQENGLLVKFYREFLANRSSDPTGIETLKRVLDEKDPAAFQKKWEKEVMKLSFP